MIYLLLSIFSSVITVSFFKLFQRYNINSFQAILGNYVVCILIGNLAADKAVITTSFWAESWFPYALFSGFLFITIFYCIGETAQKMGVSVSMVSAKLSVIIPVVFAIIAYNESISLIKIAGIIISLVAVYMISVKDESTGIKNYKLLLLPFLVFTGSGLIDSLLKYMQDRFIPPADAAGIVSTNFLIALCFGSVFAAYQFIRFKRSIEIKNLLWGFALGVPNYFSMFFLVKTLENFKASHIFPVNNIGIVALSTLASIYFFKEKLSSKNWIGFALAILSILIISIS